MSNPEKFLIEEKSRTERTVRCLRAVKGAANYGMSAWLRIKAIFNSDYRVSFEQKDNLAQTALGEGKKLAQSASTFFVSRMFNDSSSAEAEVLDADLVRLEQNYGRFKGWSNVEIDPIEAADRLRGFLHFTSVFGAAVIEAHMFQFNSLGAQNLNELLNQRIGVAAPIATDYLVASAHNEFVRRFVDNRGFDLEPVALNRDLNRVVLHRNGGLLPFQEASQLGVFVDFIGSSSTRTAAMMALQELYPDKIVHGFNWKRGAFVPSEYGFDISSPVNSSM